MKDFDLCYFVWRVLYKNEIILTFIEDNNINLRIQIDGENSNVNKELLAYIMAQLLMQDLGCAEEILVIYKPDYNDYLKFLRETEIMYRNIPKDAFIIHKQIENINLANYMINLSCAMAAKYQEYDGDISSLVNIATRDIVSQEFSVLDFKEMPIFCPINALYKCLISAFKAKMASEFVSDNIEEREIVSDKLTSTLEQLQKDNKNELEINDALNFSRFVFERETDKKIRKLYKKFDKCDFFGSDFQ